MTDAVLNVVLGLLTSAIGAAAGWLLQTLRRRRRMVRRQAFFGLPGGSECLLVVPRHMKSPSQHSVHRDDVSALMELAVLVNSCGARPDIVAHDQVRQGLGRQAEFCLGGPSSNERTAAHLNWRLPAVRFDGGSAITVGGREFRMEIATADSPGDCYALLARLDPGDGGRPVFVVSGLTAIANHAAVRYLSAHQRELARRHGEHGTFALVLRVVGPLAYGPDVVELVADVTDAATAPVATAAPAGTS
ncbi:hypothetical protein LN042_28305 [Kitasatospora sp. RB6PN24]|uniref:hypothetical protein n=1 Tax=Kitasatospora humi TaxID=2893891 RepID=UPI001E408876|nr:hypothetical protein [Kitasatospora humi]MCC9310927.1 hypothetical protein [Kitasatospora humi]